MPKHPLLLIVLDGFGYHPNHEHNAIAAANTPTWDQLLQNHPNTLISASGEDVGLPAGQMGNSEVGHMTMGAGRTIHQDLTRIDHAINTGELASNPELQHLTQYLTSTSRALHLIGLVSEGGVHSHLRHMLALINEFKQRGVTRLYVHAFLDGRDTPPRSAQGSLKRLDEALRGVGRIASIVGRYHAMDRDQRWERTQTVYRLLCEGQATWQAQSAQIGLTSAYERHESDEFVEPTIILDSAGQAATITPDDAVLFTNFRADRARQLTRAFVEHDFTAFERKPNRAHPHFYTLTQYADDLKTHVIFKPQIHAHVLGDVLAKHQLTQLRVAETEKYAHVTFFFNGGVEQAFWGEERRLIPSPKVATYDLQPHMSAEAITAEIITAMRDHRHDVIICNYANADMVGHTGDLTATVKAIEACDQALAQILHAQEQYGGEIIITADHGNAESMYDADNQQALTAHTSNPVPFLYVGRKASIAAKPHPTLADVAPTMLYLLGLPQPPEMTGSPLLDLSAHAGEL